MPRELLRRIGALRELVPHPRRPRVDVAPGHSSWRPPGGTTRGNVGVRRPGADVPGYVRPPLRDSRRQGGARLVSSSFSGLTPRALRDRPYLLDKGPTASFELKKRGRT